MRSHLIAAVVRLSLAFLLVANAYAGDAGGTFVKGWNLSGNTTVNPVNVSTAFGASAAPVSGITSNVVAIWKWNAAGKSWQLYTPVLSSSALAAYATKHGVEVLSTINSGEAYWVNASAPFALPAGVPADGTYTLTGADLVNGWNMAITGQSIAPKDLNPILQIAYGSLPPAPGASAPATSTGFVSLWAWDSTAKRWYFYAPSLDNGSGVLTNRIARWGLLDFTTAGKLLGPGVGFWVNMP